MKKIILLAALSVTTAAIAETSIEGLYDCKGSEIGTKEAFTCQMTIKKTGETYASTATCSDGNSYRGTGILDAKNHQLSTVFVNPKKAEETGVCLSVFKGDKRLVSNWTYLDKTTLGTTACQKK